MLFKMFSSNPHLKRPFVTDSLLTLLLFLMNNDCDDESASGGIAPAEAVPRSEAKRNEEYKRKTGRVMMRGGLLGFEKKE